MQPPSLHVLLVSVGTDGDIIPYVGLGATLLAKGHQATLVASEEYELLARAHGLAFRSLVSAKESEELFSNPDFWHPLKAAPLGARWGVPRIEPQYHLLSSLITRHTVLVASPGVFAAALVHEKAGVPLATLILQPWMIRSSIAPPLMPAFTFLRHAPSPIWKFFWRAMDAVGYLLVGRHLNCLRASLGLGPLRSIFRNWLSPQLVLGLFPNWYGPPQRDWPPQLQLTGFPLFDGGLSNELTPEVLEFCRAGNPPIAFTFGTGIPQSAPFFAAAVQACALLGARGILLTKHRHQLPSSLPPSVIHCPFAPFQKLFPHCAAVVHHGGIGTVAKALAAGIPQVIRPVCFDQADNALRVTQLGVGASLKSRYARGEIIAHALTKLLTPETRSRCHSISARLTNTNSLQTAAEAIERLPLAFQ